MAVADAAGTATGSAGDGTLVRVGDLKVHFPITEGLIVERHVGDVRAVDTTEYVVTFGTFSAVTSRVASAMFPAPS